MVVAALPGIKTIKVIILWDSKIKVCLHQTASPGSRTKRSDHAVGKVHQLPAALRLRWLPLQTSLVAFWWRSIWQHARPGLLAISMTAHGGQRQVSAKVDGLLAWRHLTHNRRIGPTPLRNPIQQKILQIFFGDGS